MEKAFAAFVVFVLTFGIGGTMLYYSASQPVQFTVEHKERVVSCSGGDSGSSCDSVYLLFTDITTYKIEDSLVKFRFNSSDVYGRIRVGQTCTATAYGWRIGFLSTYQNLFDIQCENI
jgi:hypothetical protein